MLEPRSPTAHAHRLERGEFVSVTETVTQTRHRCFVLVDTIGAEGGTCSESFLGVTGVHWPTRTDPPESRRVPKRESETELFNQNSECNGFLISYEPVPVLWQVQIVLGLPSNEYTNASWCTGGPNGSSERPDHVPTSVAWEAR